jgi:hypothetical protein
MEPATTVEAVAKQEEAQTIAVYGGRVEIVCFMMVGVWCLVALWDGHEPAPFEPPPGLN